MSKKEEFETYNRYIIPVNFENGSRLFGFIKLPNAIETVVIAGGVGFFMYYLLSYLHVDITIFVAVMCITIIPLAIFCIIGIDGTDLVGFVVRMFMSIKNRKHIVRRENYNAALKEKQSK